MKKIIMGIITFCMFLTSLNAYVKNDVVDVAVYDMKFNPEDEVLIDCQDYKTEKLLGIFEYREYSKGSVLNDLMFQICDARVNFIAKKNKEKVSIAKIKELIKDKDINLKIYGFGKAKSSNFIDEKKLAKETKRIFLYLSEKEDNPFSIYPLTYSLSFPFVKIKTGREISLKITRQLTDDFSNYDIKKYNIDIYEFDVEKMHIKENLKFKKPLLVESKKYTNTYNIDENSECINGLEWVKKYGQKSGSVCEWIEVK